jgi:hypothetical protein
MRYAAQTLVSPDRSRAEIERILSRYGADQFAYGSSSGQVLIGFRAHSKMVRFVLEVPSEEDEEFRTTPTGRRRRGGSAAAERFHQQEVRRLWRALALGIKAKLEMVSSGIVTFEEEFLAHIVLPDGQTVGDHAIPALETAYLSKKSVPLLPAFGGRS